MLSRRIIVLFYYYLVVAPHWVAPREEQGRESSNEVVTYGYTSPSYYPPLRNSRRFVDGNKPARLGGASSPLLELLGRTGATTICLVLPRLPQPLPKLVTLLAPIRSRAVLLLLFRRGRTATIGRRHLFRRRRWGASWTIVRTTLP